jgi:eukaryotic-like serine/threonine-protein kinase
MSSFWRKLVREAHRRSVWQVLGVYLVGSWIAYQVVLGLHDGLGLPGWVPAMAVVLFVIGLPVVLATAIVQEGPPLGRGAGGDVLPHPTAPSDRDPRADANAATQPDTPNTPDTPDTPAGPARPATPARPGSDHKLDFLTWRRSLAAGVAAFALLALGAAGYMAMRHLGIGPAGTLMARGVLEERDPVVLADFQAGERDAALAAAVGEALRIDLIQSPVLRVAEPGPVRSALERMQHPPGAPLTEEVARQLAVREGYKAVIAGEVSSLGSGWMLTARLVAADDGTTLAALREPARDSTEVIDAVDRLSRQLRERVGESLRSIRASRPLSQVSTPSLPALRTYSEAELLLREAGDNLAVVGLLEDAVRMDSTFAMGWRRLATVLGNLGIRAADRMHALSRTYELRDRLPEIERQHAIGAYQAWVMDDPEAAIAAYRQVLSLAPDDPIALNNLPLQLVQLRQFAEAERILNRAIVHNESANPWINLIGAQMALGRLEDAHATYARALERFPDNVSLIGVGRAFHFLDGRWEQVDSIARAHQERFPDHPYVQATARMDRMRAALLHGRLREFAALRTEVDEIARNLDLVPELLATALWHAGATAYVRGDTLEAMRMVDDALRRYPLESIDPPARPYASLASAYAAAGRFADAEAMIEAGQAWGPVGRRPSRDLEIVDATLDLRRGDPEAALETLHRATRTGMCTICGLDVMGQAYEALGQPDSARTAYERYLTAPMLGRANVEAFHRPAALVRAAELHEAAGDLDLARQRYAEFLRLWNDADPELQPRVEAIRRRLAAVEG